MKPHILLKLAAFALAGSALAQIESAEGYKSADMVFGPISSDESKEDAWQIRPHRITAFSKIEVLDPSGGLVEHRYVPRTESLGEDARTEVLFLIDTSDPGRKKDVQAAREIAVNLMKQAPQHFRFGVGIFGKNLNVIQGVEAEQAAVQLALMEDGHYEAQQDTRLYWGLVQAVDKFQKQQSTTRRVIMVFSDGVAEDNPQGYSADDVIVAAKKKNIGIVTVALVKDVRQETFANSLKVLSYGTSSPAIKLKPTSKGTKYVLAEDVKARFFEHLDAGGELYLPKFETSRTLKLKLLTSLSESHEVDLYQTASSATDASGGDDKTGESGEPGEAEKPEEEVPSTQGDSQDGGDGKKPAGEADSGGSNGEKPPAKEAAVKEDQGMFTTNEWMLIGGAAVVAAMVIAGIVLLVRRNSAGTGAVGNTYLELADNSAVRYPVSGSAVRIGRGQDNGIRLANNSVSKHHAEILRNREGKLLITDLSSGNGVFVNGNRVDSAELFHGDLIELGEVHLIVRNP
ncbi:MAG TPA: FHA domain-containing protein [Luteolibacter sp.]|nr:FHA domain-containing protein [Luteolibacter sp.]